MSDTHLIENPFKVFTPEDLGAQEIMELFVEVPYLNKIQDPGNTMLNGPRGTGKSMLFRYLMPDCQIVVHNTNASGLPFYGVMISIKNTVPNLTELRRLQDRSARMILSEHALSCFVASKVFQSMVKTLSEESSDSSRVETAALHGRLVDLLIGAGSPEKFAAEAECNGTVISMLDACKKMCDDAYASISRYAKLIAFQESAPPYDGALCDYFTFLYPILREIRKLTYFPGSSPIYLLIDDADHLSLEQTMVLNSWLVARTQGIVSIKVSTQHNYKTFTTLNGNRIRSPHDYQEINMTDLYTTRKSAYDNNVRKIIKKRLKRANIHISPKKFFPPDVAQEGKIKEIGDRLRESWSASGRGYSASDDVLRYARPQFMKSLGGSSKSTSTYSYAGLDQLIHISSGQIRYLLQPAAEMYDEQKSESPDGVVTRIDPSIQNRVVRQEANRLMFRELDDLKNGDFMSDNVVDNYRNNIARLRNLIAFLGGMFYRKLVSEDAERRVFSIAVSGRLDKLVRDVFEFGVGLGYFHPSSIGNKDGTGRTRLYVLTRRLAPHFNLDPSSFAGYQFITGKRLRQAIEHPETVLRQIKARGTEWLEEDPQESLF